MKKNPRDPETCLVVRIFDILEHDSRRAEMSPVCVIVFNAVVCVGAAATVFGAVRRCVHLRPRVGIVCDQCWVPYLLGCIPSLLRKKNSACSQKKSNLSRETCEGNRLTVARCGEKVTF